MARHPRKQNRYKKSPGTRRLRCALGVLAALVTVTATGTVCVLAHDLLTQCAFFSAKRIEIDGARRLKAAEIRRQAALAPGVNILQVNLATVRYRLLAHPYIAQASIRRRLPDAIEIRIREHMPLAILDLGRRFLIDHRGRVFKEWDDRDPRRLPLIKGLRFLDLNVDSGPATAPWRAVLEVLELGRQPGSAIPNARIREIRVDHHSGLTIDGLDGIGTVRIGFDAYEVKYQRLKSVMLYLEEHVRRFPAQTSIDIANLNRVILTPAHPDTSAGKGGEV